MSCINCQYLRKKYFVFFKCKKQSNDDITYYTVPEYIGQNPSDVYKQLSKLYPDHRIASLTSRTTANFLDRDKIIFIYHEFENDVVTGVEIY